MQDADDRALLAAWAGGDAEAGNVLVQRHFSSVYAFFANKVGEPEDLVQRTFLACIEAHQRFRGEAKFRGFVLGIARNVLLMHLRTKVRRDKRFVLAEVSAAELDPSASGIVARREEERLLIAALRRLPLDQQIILELHYWEGATMVEIADVVELSVGTVKSKIRRARQLLREGITNAESTDALRTATIENLDAWVKGLREVAQR